MIDLKTGKRLTRRDLLKVASVTFGGAALSASGEQFWLPRQDWCRANADGRGGRARDAGGKSAAMGGVVTARDYVQDGLYFMIDAIENVGYGRHDPNPSSIRPIGAYVGDNFIPHDVTFAEDRMIFNGTSSYITAGSWLLARAALQIEAAFKFNANQSGMIFQSSQAGYRNDYQQAELNWHNTVGFVTAAGYGYSGGNGAAYACPYATVSRRVSASVAFSKTLSGEACRTDGLYLANSPMQMTAQSNNGNNDYRSIIGAAGTLAGYFLNGEIYCVRIYSRNLTDAERAHNYEVDKARFGVA